MSKPAYTKKQRCADCDRLTDVDMLCIIMINGDRTKLCCESCMRSLYEGPSHSNLTK